MIIDTHTHLYLEKFQDDIDEVVQRALDSKVNHMLLPNIDESTIDQLFDLCQKYPENIHPMVGLHPCSVDGDYIEKLEILMPYLEKNNVAVGEIGMDLYWEKKYKNEQIEAFNLQIEWALNRQLPIVIHSRNAMDECIDIVKNWNTDQLHGVFHCFDQDKNRAKKILDLDFYLGLGGVITFKKNTVVEVLDYTGLEKIILETDSPYLTPHPFRGKRNESSYITYVAKKIAEHLHLEYNEVCQITTMNAKKLFRLNQII